MSTTLNTKTDTSALAEDGDRRMVEHLEDILMQHLEKLRDYDLDGAMPLAEEANELALKMGNMGLLDKAEFADERTRIDKLYTEIGLVITKERQEVSEKLKEIHDGLETLGQCADD